MSAPCSTQGNRRGRRNVTLTFDETPETAASVSFKVDAGVSASWVCTGGQTIDTQTTATNTVTGVMPDSTGRVRGSIELARPTAPSTCQGAVLRRVTIRA